MIRLAAVALVALTLAPAALACNSHPSLAAMEGQIMCPVCGTTLDQSNSPAAAQIKRVIAQRIAAGDSDCRIKERLVAQYGDSILAAPPRHGLGLLAWWLPIGGIVIAAVLLGAGAWRWSRARAPGAGDLDSSLDGRDAIDPALERRVDEELAGFDR